MAVSHREPNRRTRAPASPNPCRLFLAVVAGLVALSQAGCMSAITNAALRNALLDSINTTLAFNAPEERHRRKKGPAIEEDTGVASQEDAPDAIAEGPAPEPMSLDEAVERAVKRLSEMGEVDAATQATLLSMLESTKPEDWPAAIDAFAAALEANRPTRPALPPETRSPVVHVTHQAADPPADSLVAPADDVPPAVADLQAVATEQPSESGTDQSAQQSAQHVATPEVFDPEVFAPELASGSASPPPRLIIEPASDAPASQPPADVGTTPRLEVRNPCFVSRVRGWGEVDRFPDHVFRPGQDLIVYFELENLAARVSPEGHSTSIDTLLRLVSPDGTEFGRWAFPPVEETCQSPRRDYFARYLIRVPEACPAGPCRMEISVSDRIGGTSTQTQLTVDVR